MAANVDSGVTDIPKNKAPDKPSVPDPFLPERLSEYSGDPPAIWSNVNPSIWLFRLHFFFGGDVAEVDLGVSRIRQLGQDDLAVMHACEEERQPLGLAADFGLPVTKWDDFQGRELPWVLEVHLPQGSFEDVTQRAHYLQRSAEVALRLVGNRYVFTSGPVIFQPTVVGSLTGEFRLGPIDFPEVPTSLQYRLSARDEAVLRAVHHGALVAKDRRARIALRRFHLGYGKGGDDSVIDLWIGLEALFSDGGSEITYKAAMRIASYVGQGSSSRRFLFNALKASYHVRSQIVHGSHPRDSNPARRVATEALRLSLLKILSLGRTPDIGELDKIIAAGGG